MSIVKHSVDTVKQHAFGHWPSIVSRVGGISDEFLSTNHGPCPKCDGGARADRWRVFDDFSESGGAICNRCGKFGDGIALLEWYCGWTFQETLQKIADHLGIQPEKKRGRKKKDTTPGSNDPAQHLEFLPWNLALVKTFCRHKPPITPEAIEAVGGRLAKYRKRYTVVAIPGRDCQGVVLSWTLYEFQGGTLPRFAKGSSEPVEQLKVKVTTGSVASWIG